MISNKRGLLKVCALKLTLMLDSDWLVHFLKLHSSVEDGRFRHDTREAGVCH